jgi:hypothetical protein
MSLGSVLADTGAHNRARVEVETFGHLAPKPAQVYRGYILFTLGNYGDITIIRDDFGDLPSSPWYFRDLNDFCADKIMDKDNGTIWRFEGTYRVSKRDFKGRFVGRITEVVIADRSEPKRKRAKR